VTGTTAALRRTSATFRRWRSGCQALGLLLVLGCLCQPAPQSFRANPLLGLAGERGTVAGVIVEQLPAGPYYYARLRLGDGQSRWVVGMGKGPGAGAAVAARLLGTRRGFYSPRLQRRFDSLSFVWIH
jgi:hypothetical protein